MLTSHPTNAKVLGENHVDPGGICMKKLRAFLSITLCLAVLFAAGAIPLTGSAAGAEDGAFKVADAVFNSFSEAMNASADSGKPAVLLRDVAFGAGEYTVPAGATFLIPCDSSDSGSVTAPRAVSADPAQTSAFRTLTLNSGAKLIVGGSLAVSGSVTVAEAGRDSVLTGAYGALTARSGSSVTVVSGGKLYAWGRLGGDGAITAQDGSTVYERMELCGYQGFAALLNALNERPDVFPFTRASLGSIEAPLTLNSGAVDVCGAYIRFMIAAPALITRALTGDGGYFSLSEGASVAKRVDASAGRTSLSFSGDITAAGSVFTIDNSRMDLSGSAIPLDDTDIVVADGELSLAHRLLIGSSGSLTVNSPASLVVDGGLYVEGSPDINGKLTVNGELGTVSAPMISSEGCGSVCFSSVEAPRAARYTESGEIESLDCSSPDLENSDGSTVSASGREEGSGYKMSGGVWQPLITIDLFRADGVRLGYAYAESGKKPVLPTPGKYYDDYYQYIFHFWKPALTPATERTVYTAVYRKYLRTDSGAKARLRGDANGDGEVDILDATHIQRWLVGLDKPTSGIIEVLGDADGDGSTSILDATCIQRYLAGFQNDHRVDRPIFWSAPTETPVVNPTERPTQAPTQRPTQPPVQGPTDTPLPTEPYELPVI